MEDPLEGFRAELRAHCYRMLGSAHDAEDVLQEVSLRAWRGRADFQGRSSLRTWLHRIATNACLNELERKERRVLPIDFGPEAEPGSPFDQPLHEVPWLEPFPEDPEERAEQRESVELAFVAAVQHLGANQRAALLMFDVLGFSAQEIADAMDTSAASVNSALQRARKAIEERLPERTQQETLKALGDQGQKELVERYMRALERSDMDAMLALLTEDATWSMPPLANWYRGHAGDRRLPRARPVHGRLAAPSDTRERPARGRLLRVQRRALPGLCARRARAPRRPDRGDRRVPRRLALRGLRAAADTRAMSPAGLSGRY